MSKSAAKLYVWTYHLDTFFFCPATFGYINNNSPNAKIHFLYSAMSGLGFFGGTYSSCRASGLNFSLVLTPVELVLKSGILKETKHIIQ